MKTSHSQYATMIEYMEANGDLSKTSGGPRCRHFIQMKWKDLTAKLNSDRTGDPKSEDKWRKVWSDYKNNCKKKVARIKRNTIETGHTSQLSLTDHESRVMHIIGTHAPYSLPTEDDSFQDTVSESNSPPPEQSEMPWENLEKDLNFAATNKDHPAAPPPPSENTPLTVKVEPPMFVEVHPPSTVESQVDEEEWRPPPQKKKTYLSEFFLELDKRTRDDARGRDREHYDLEKERLKLKMEECRVKEFEIRERVRQRDEELKLQGKWLEIMKEALSILNNYMEKK